MNKNNHEKSHICVHKDVKKIITVEDDTIYYTPCGMYVCVCIHQGTYWGYKILSPEEFERLIAIYGDDEMIEKYCHIEEI